jgi:hypothetical protein
MPAITGSAFRKLLAESTRQLGFRVIEVEILSRWSLAEKSGLAPAETCPTFQALTYLPTSFPGFSMSDESGMHQNPQVAWDFLVQRSFRVRLVCIRSTKQVPTTTPKVQ